MLTVYSHSEVEEAGNKVHWFRLKRMDLTITLLTAAARADPNSIPYDVIVRRDEPKGRRLFNLEMKLLPLSVMVLLH